MKTPAIKNVYFLGIGGIGMSALARYFHSQGIFVSGYDKTPTSLTSELIAEGIDVHFKDNPELIPASILADKKGEQSLIIYTPAIPAEQTEFRFLKGGGYALKKRSEVLGLLTNNSFSIAVAGTHGKTTTSSILAHILTACGLNCTAFLGGISKNYQTNFLIGDPKKGKEYIVVEADEYDRSFLALTPDVTIITSMDADHLDIYGDAEYMRESYRLFASQLKSGGKLFYRHGLPLQDIHVTKSDYSVSENGEYCGEKIEIKAHQYHFSWRGPNEVIHDVTMQMPGIHNVENAVAAICVAKYLNLSNEAIVNALKSYSGVKRRFDYLWTGNRVYIDDYAHHPEELRACISSVRELYPGRKITGIFQPHLYSRTRDFSAGFASVLSMLDHLILLDIYPARELPIPGITSAIIFDEVTIADKVLCTKDQALEELKKGDHDIVLTVGAGDIDQLVQPIREYLKALEQ